MASRMKVPKIEKNVTCAAMSSDAAAIVVSAADATDTPSSSMAVRTRPRRVVKCDLLYEMAKWATKVDREADEHGNRNALDDAERPADRDNEAEERTHNAANRHDRHQRNDPVVRGEQENERREQQREKRRPARPSSAACGPSQCPARRASAAPAACWRAGRSTRPQCPRTLR
eukprot:TRINITY_DN543_c0_g2_i5.p2 TRINITY_DN543_c0_g2~~TRINITY_DN543_c0_g2_i5.p2  ORF type:complete len:173 (-),score=41.43 TRINITY_DN543_c0_g2_i5:74-592(-)